MKSQSLPISFFLLCFFLVVNGDIVTDVCKKVAQDPNVSYDFCVKTLQADPKSHTATLQELGLISMKLINSNASSVKFYVEKLIYGATDPREKTALQNCLDVYNNAIEYISDANTAFVNKDYKTANIRLSAALDAASDCEDGFKGGLAFRLAKPNKDYSGVVEIGLAITNMF